MTHKDRDREIASRFERVEVIDNGAQGEQLSFTYTAPKVRDPDRYRVWISGYNPRKPWRTAKLEKFTDRLGGTQDRFTTHAGHESLEDAFKWLQALD